MSDDARLPRIEKVVKMPNPATDRREADLMAFANYWESKRRGHDVPLRAEIDPRGIESLLPNAFIAEKIAPGQARMRVAGTHLSDLMGMEVRGLPLLSLIMPEDRARVSNALVDVFERPAQLRLRLVSPPSLRHAVLGANMLVLPLRSDLGDISRALGCLVSDGTIGAAPRRFRVADLRVTPVSMGVDPVAHAFAEEQAPFIASVQKRTAMPGQPPIPSRHDSERPYLRLVHND